MNKDNYKKAIDQIHVKESLKQNTFEKVLEQKNSKKKTYIKYFISCAAMFLIIFSTGIIYIKNEEKVNNNNNIQISKKTDDLPRFENIEQLKKVIKKNQKDNEKKNYFQKESIITDITTATNSNREAVKEKSDYSKTNVQVENVDEADIVKTDGNYIYYVSNETVYIVKADELKIVSKIKREDKNDRFAPNEIFINNNKLVILGMENSYQTTITQSTSDVARDYVGTTSSYQTKAYVYDISNKENPKQIREVALDGNYNNSRMIGDNVYFITTKGMRYFYDQIKDEDILPKFKDTVVSYDMQTMKCTDIAYFNNTESSNYLLVAGFNINNNEKVNIETFFGASDIVYASEKNLYITETVYDNYYDEKENTIYKFNLDNSKVKLQCKGKVNGYLNSQFSMDEYDGKLRIATTSDYSKDSTNAVYVFDENLNQIGKLEDLAKGEKIYSVRFIGKVGYVVTFKQVDPLFVIDLSDPKNPEVKGQLKIPGYSSYLHPYDENHIIGIGYNTKSNGYGGITNSSMKMSMFDVSNLEDPKELFNINIGDDYAYSEVLSEHKALFYNKEKDLIGFPITYRGKRTSNDKNGFVIYKIDLNKGFEKYGEITQEINYKTNFDRAIYIGNTFYTLSESKIISYDLNTINKLNELNLD